MTQLARRMLTPQEYLEIERRAEWKSEHFDGQMWAMAGGTFNHSLIGTARGVSDTQ
jgi:hypothetical protein